MLLQIAPILPEGERKKFQLRAISPVDGRYGEVTLKLQNTSSEWGLINYRFNVGRKYLKALAADEEISKAARFTERDKEIILAWTDRPLTEEEVNKVKEIEKRTNHDVNALLEFMGTILKFEGLSEQALAHIHFAMTSADLDNISRSWSLLDSEDILAEKIVANGETMVAMAKEQANTAMLTFTHGQPATPSTFGHMVAVFVDRSNYLFKEVRGRKIRVKFGGATGTMAAHKFAYPDIEWRAFAKKFVEGLHPRFEYNGYTTQIESYDSHALYFGALVAYNNVLIDFCRDMWTYISMEYVKQRPKAGEVGSSAMPHKVNPIDFENAEGNLLVANALLNLFKDKLQISRLYRDLTDSTVIRNWGMSLAYCLIAYNSIARGLGKIQVDVLFMHKDLMAHPQVIMEAIQTFLRTTGDTEAYNKCKEFSRGASITMEDITDFIDSLSIDRDQKDYLHTLRADTYTGYASEIAATINS